MHIQNKGYSIITPFNYFHSAKMYLIVIDAVFSPKRKAQILELLL